MDLPERCGSRHCSKISAGQHETEIVDADLFIAERRRTHGALRSYHAQGLLELVGAESGGRSLRQQQQICAVRAEFFTELPGHIVIERDKSREDRRSCAYCEQRLARHKVPRYIELVDSFPMNAAGKVLKYKMREDAARELGFSVEEADRLGS